MSNNLSNLFGDIANAIKNKSNDYSSIMPVDFPSRIYDLPVEDSSRIEVEIVNHSNRDIMYFDSEGFDYTLGRGSHIFYEKPPRKMVSIYLYYGNELDINFENVRDIHYIINREDTYEKLALFTVGTEGNYCRFDIDYWE